MLRKIMLALGLAALAYALGYGTALLATFFVPGFQMPHVTIVLPFLPAAHAATVAGSRVDNGDHTFWYLTRASGLAAYLVLFVNMALGIMVKTKLWDRLVARWQSFDLHQFTALLALGFLGVHGLTLLGDAYIGFAPWQIVIPFISDYRPFWTGVGIIAMYLTVVVTVSFYVKNRMGQKRWRSLHYASFIAYLMALMHGVFAGTDTAMPWAQGMYVGTVFLLVSLTVWRFLDASDKRAATPARAPKQTTS